MSSSAYPYNARVVGPEGFEVCGSRLRRKCGSNPDVCPWAKAGDCPVEPGDPCPCSKPPRVGRPRCKLHGGNTPRGLDLPQTKTGERSLDFPTALRARFEAARSDPELLDLRDEIAALRAVWEELGARLDSNDGPAAWEAARDALEDLRAAGEIENEAAAARAASGAMRKLEGIISGRLAGFAVLDKWLEVADRKRRLFDSQRRRDDALRTSIPIERAMLFLSTLTDAVDELLSELPLSDDDRIRARRRFRDRVDIALNR